MTYLCVPEPVFTLRCLNILTDPQEFVLGRRDALGKKAERLSDAELLPGLFDLTNEEDFYIMEGDYPEMLPDKETKDGSET